MQKEMEAGSWRGKAKADGQAARIVPNVLAQYKEDTMRTTGQLPFVRLAIIKSMTSFHLDLITLSIYVSQNCDKDFDKVCFSWLALVHALASQHAKLCRNSQSPPLLNTRE